MILTLQVVGARARDLRTANRKVFNGIGGTIGRLPDNDWVFPDPYISGRHALIRYLNGSYYVEDTSTNGVAINSPENRVSRTEAQRLRHGDLLYIDAYEISVSIKKDARSQDKDPFARLHRAAGAGPGGGQARDEDHTVGLEPRAQARVSGTDPDAVANGRAGAAQGTEWFGLDETSPSLYPAFGPAAARLTRGSVAGSG